MKVLALFAAVVAVAAAAPFADMAENLVHAEWEAFKATHDKVYDTEVDDKFHKDIYIENRILIDTHNELYAKGEVSYELEANEYTDVLNDEFLDMLNGYDRPVRKGLVPSNVNLTTHSSTFIPTPNAALPDRVDWRERGAVTGVKNQGGCGSCYAFSAIGSLEGQHFLRKGKLVSLSEQNIVDCSRKHGNNGCGGGWMTNVFNYVRDNHGVDTEQSYPYTARGNDPCRFDARFVGATNTNSVGLPSGNEEALKQAVATIGPISVAMQATKSFVLYKSGVYFNPECDKNGRALNHGVLAVGYGRDAHGGDYWLVKNSWGGKWGDHGYARMARNRRNNCGVATAPSYPLV